MQKKNLSKIALSGLLALSMVPAASMQIYADNKTAEESTSGGGKNKYREANVYFTVNPAYGSFTGYGTNSVSFEHLNENSDEQYLIPAVTAKEGYKFVGWKGQGADAIEWDADAKTFGVTGLCHFAEGETEGYASLEAVFEKVDTPAKEDNKKDDSKKEDSKKEDSKKEDSKKEDSKKADSKKEDNKVSTGAATGLFGSLAGVTAAGASLVALLRKKNSK